MTSRLNPYISFNGDARQAMEFYKDVFGGTLAVSTFGEFGAPDAEGADKIMHAMLESDNGFTLMGADTPPGMEHNPGTNIAVSLSGDDGDLLIEACCHRVSFEPASSAPGVTRILQWRSGERRSS